MASSEQGTLAMVGVIFIVLSVAALFPAIIIAQDTAQTNSFEQVEENRYVITGSLTTRAKDIRPSQDTANVTILNGRTGDFATTGEISIGDTETVTINGDTVNVTLVHIQSDTEAIFTYDYPLYLGWPSGAQLVVSNLTEIIMALTVIFAVSTLFTVYGVYVDD